MKTSNWKYYNCRSLFGNTWAWFYVIIGARGAGKSYDVMKRFIQDYKKSGKEFTWLRLTEASTKKLLNNNADKLVDPDLRRKFDLELTVKGCQVYDHGQKMCKVLALSTFYNDKGVALFDNEYDLGYNICLDEMNREQSEKRTFDINYCFVNQMENLVRDTKDKLRIVLIGNTLQEASDIMCCFDFIPETFGRYKIRKKKCVIDYLPNTQAYRQRRKGTVADILMPEQSTFTNEVKVDKSLVYNKRITRPCAIIKFSKDKNDWFTIYDTYIITKYNGEQCSNIIPMRPYLGDPFTIQLRDNIISQYDTQLFRYHTLLTHKLFTRQLTLIRKG